MGMSGGFKIVPISDFYENWERIREKVEMYLNEYIEEEEERGLVIRNINAGLNEESLQEILDLFKYCDTPAIFDKFIFLGCGDNIGKKLKCLSYALSDLDLGETYETWT